MDSFATAISISLQHGVPLRFLTQTEIAAFFREKCDGCYRGALRHLPEAGLYFAGLPHSTPLPLVPRYTLPKIRGSPVICLIQAYLCYGSSIRCHVAPSFSER